MKKDIIETEIVVQENKIRVMRVGNTDYISLTDLSRYANEENPANVIIHWMSSKNTFNYIGLWEQLNNENFNFTEFSEIKNNELVKSSFTLSPRKWIAKTNAIGMISKGGKYSIGTFAHPDIAFEFASWLSPEFKLYLIKEFERLKKEEAQEEKLTWESTRILSKINYTIQTESIKNNLIPELTIEQQNAIYKNEADILNVAVFGMTANEWKQRYPDKAKYGNIRDYASLIELIILSNLEAMNSLLIEKNISASNRLVILNKAAKSQIKVLAKEKQNLLKQ